MSKNRNRTNQVKPIQKPIGDNVKLNDSLSSVYTSLGQNINAIQYNQTKLNEKQLLDMYSSSWIVQKYIDKTAGDMLKTPRELAGDIDDSLTKIITDFEKEKDIAQVFNDALTWSSLLGDSLILAVTDCAVEQFADNVDIESESIVRFVVFRKGEYKLSSELDLDILSEHFGEPLYYNLTIGKKSIKVHRSRCHRTSLGKRSITKLSEFGESDIISKYQTIKIFDTAITSIGDTIQEANVDVIFLPDLNLKIAAGRNKEVVEALTLLKLGKSNTGILAIDAGNATAQGRYEQKNAQFSGLSEVITKLANVLSGALDRPITVLFGQSASGFSSGEEDNKAYYETINALQESRLRPMQEFVDYFMLDWLGISENISFSYPSIDSINKTEESSRFNAYATGFTSMVQEGVISEEIALRELVARELLLTVTEDDIQVLNQEGLQFGASDNPREEERHEQGEKAEVKTS